MELPPGEVRISVRALVEFLLRQGDIDNRHQASPENAMQEGSRIHRMIQRRMGADYQAEVGLRYTFPTENYTLVVEGRADGIIDNAQGVTVDEIKGTYRELSHMKEPVPVHVAQAKCYAYIYSLQKELQEIRVRMTYCNIETEDIRYFYEDYTFPQLERWFLGLIGDYRKWSDYTWEWRRVRQRSIEGLEFPFPYREGQRELVSYVYQTIYHKRKLFLEAPTGVGKTISTIFPAVKAMGKGMGDRMGDRLFYLTAKTITRTVADDTLEILRGKGLRFKSVILTAKEKICFMGHTECNPDSCPYAKGHYDRINEAMYALLTAEERFSREVIEEYAVQYQVCPFEFCLDMSLFADAIIGDYNYLFDPHVYLKRFFAEGAAGNYLFLIDEAHNLVERGREMYSASLLKEDFLELKREIQQTIMSELEGKNRSNQVSGQMTLDMTGMSQDKAGNLVSASLTDVSSGGLFGISDQVSATESDEASATTPLEVSDADTDEAFGKAGKSSAKASGKSAKTSAKRGGHSILVRQGYGEKLKHRLDACNKQLLELKRECESSRQVEEIDGFVNALMRLYSTMSDYLEEQGEAALPVRERILDFYFEVSHFLNIYERVDEHYIKYTQMQEDGSFLLKLFCVNPRENLKECMARGRSSILFSATLLPIQYYKELLGGEPEDYEVYAKSVFNPEKRGLFIANDVTSKYSRRSDEEYYRIARYVDEIVRNRHGNYMVFCPSYSFMQKIYALYEEHFATEEKECIIQQDSMSEEDREAFLDRFRGNSDLDLQQEIHMDIEVEDHTLIGFCVLGGIFGEGIDLKNDSLIGAIIVGTGIPQVCYERELLKKFFDEREENGFDYAYRYPGMNKVLQAAGRVIRTVEDVGIIALLDERFLQMSTRRLFPREWESFETVSVDGIAKRVERFWDSWL
ncbi:MAG: ATP-dependent DNA helicase [Butyrivibrio sp.]|nr:ATP-dependent DNA helicase [Butyrivibrio sp.]